MLLVVSEVSGLLGRVAWGVLSDDVFGGRRVVVLQIAAAVAALCSALLAVIPGDITWVWVVLVVVLFGFTVTGFNGVWMNAASEAAPREVAGLATGLIVSVGSLGVMQDRVYEVSDDLWMLGIGYTAANGVIDDLTRYLLGGEATTGTTTGAMGGTIITGTGGATAGTTTGVTMESTN